MVPETSGYTSAAGGLSSCTAEMRPTGQIFVTTRRCRLSVDDRAPEECGSGSAEPRAHRCGSGFPTDPAEDGRPSAPGALLSLDSRSEAGGPRHGASPPVPLEPRGAYSAQAHSTGAREAFDRVPAGRDSRGNSLVGPKTSWNPTRKGTHCGVGMEPGLCRRLVHFWPSPEPQGPARDWMAGSTRDGRGCELGVLGRKRTHRRPLTGVSSCRFWPPPH